MILDFAKANSFFWTKSSGYCHSVPTKLCINFHFYIPYLSSYHNLFSKFCQSNFFEKLFCRLNEFDIRNINEGIKYIPIDLLFDNGAKFKFNGRKNRTA